MSKQSKVTLIVDGNWLLMSRLSVLTNQYSSDEETCKELQLLMLKSINRVLNTFQAIDNIIFIADGGSWRNKIEIPQFLYEEHKDDESIEYKGQRHLDESLINWDIVFKYYEDFIDLLEKNGITTCRKQNIEGDDWCWYWSTKLNEEGTNVIIWSMDKDLTQLVNTNDQNGIFTICWNMRLGMTCEKKETQEEDPLQFFFNDLSKEYNTRLFESIADKCKNITQIIPKEVVIDKIIRGDKGDNIFPIIVKKSNNVESTKTFRVSVKDIDFDLNLHDDNEIKKYIHNIVTSKKYFNKIKKSEENIFEHFKYNYQLVSLSEDNYPKEVLEDMNSYMGYHVNNNVSEVLSYLTARNSGLTTILDEI
jgi:5'-3' exonuclease